MVTDANGNGRNLSYDLAGSVTVETDVVDGTKQCRYERIDWFAGVIDDMGSKTS